MHAGGSASGRGGVLARRAHAAQRGGKGMRFLCVLVGGVVVERRISAICLHATRLSGGGIGQMKAELEEIPFRTPELGLALKERW